MIFVDRSSIPPPPLLLRFRERSIGELEQAYRAGALSLGQRPSGFLLPASVVREVREHLSQLFKHRCAYCERPAQTIDHFRPKRRASRLDRHIDVDHYWWLFAEWNNLYLACHECNARKANAFPIDGPAAPLLTNGLQLNEEQPLLVDPCYDRPEQHLMFRNDGTVDSLSRKGDVTIKLLELNNPHLVRARDASYKMTFLQCGLHWENGARENSFDVARRLLEDVSDLDYVAVARTAIDDFVASKLQTDRQQVVPFRQPMDEQTLPKAVWLDRVEISNFKSIAHLELSFPVPNERPSEPSLEEEAKVEESDFVGQPWLMILGENGVGKSSLLQAIALALMPESDLVRQGKASKWLRRQEGVEVAVGRIRLTFSDESTRELEFGKKGSRFRITGSQPPMAVLAYGSTRLLPRGRRKMEKPAKVSVDNLFNNRHPLSHTERYLCDKAALSEEQFDLLAGSLKSLLPIPEATDLKRIRGRLSARVGGRTVNLDQLSDGYKSMLALAMDVMFHLTNSSYDMESAVGLVLIDELELHLHPRWKVAIVRQLRALFPNVRFVATTHDPLCVLGLRPEELQVLTVDQATRDVRMEQVDVPKGTRADEVLTGPWFGVASTIDAETQYLMAEHARLIVRPDLQPDNESRRLKIEAILSSRLAGYATTRSQRAILAAAAVLNPARTTADGDAIMRQRLLSLLARREAEPGKASDA